MIQFTTSTRLERHVKLNFIPFETKIIGLLIQGQISYLTPYMRHKESGQSITTRLHNEMDQPIQNKPKKRSYYRNEGHNRRNGPFRQ